MKKTALIIGYGSSGKKHYDILSKLKVFSSIHILTKQKIKNKKKIENLKQIKKLDPDYIVISSRTSEHFKHLLYLEKKLTNKKILVEKPLFEKNRSLIIKKNKVFVGFNLRFHPVIRFIYKYIKNKKILNAKILCHSYLPDWRNNIHYSKSNSAKKSYGGGVLLELSHEIDYAQLLFGKIKSINKVEIMKKSNLMINTEDSAIISAQSNKTKLHIDLNFFSLTPNRTLELTGYNIFIKGDLVNNKLFILKNKKKIQKKFNFKKDYTYVEEHKAIINNKYTNLCSFEEAKSLMKLIDKIKIYKN